MRRITLASILVFLLSGAASANGLSEAMDTSLIFETGGDADWFAQTWPWFSDYDSAESGDVGDNQVSWIQTTIHGSGTLSFYWKVSSERHYDDLKFFIDGVLQDRISETVDWHQMTYEIVGSGLHTLEWRYVKDHSVSEGDDSGWVDRVEWSGVKQSPVGSPISEALDTSFNFTTDGDTNWFSQKEITFFDGDAVQSGVIFDEQESLLSTTISSSGIFSFYWKVSSEANYDFLEFYIDGVLQDRISGMQDWHQMVYEFTDSLVHTLQWRYVKDGSISSGSDSGWIDLVEWSGVIGTQPPVGGPLSQALDTSLTLTTDGDAEWFLQTDIVLFDGDAAQSGPILHDQESLIHTTVSGVGMLQFYWKVSSEAGYDFLEFYIDGVLQDRISGTQDWDQMVYTISGSGLHTLDWRYVKDESISSGSDSGWIDLVMWTDGTKFPSSPLSQALDTDLSFTTAGQAGWFSQTTMSYFGGDAAQSGAIFDNQESLIRTTVSETGTLSFYWKISSEAGYDFLEFYIEGVLQDSISGTLDWQQMMYTITGSGMHELEWRYVKDFNVSEGDDSGWLDQVQWSGSTKTPSTGPLSQALDTNLNINTAGDEQWFFQTAMSYFGGDAAQSGTVLDNQQSLLSTTVSGSGMFSFYWKVSSEADYDFLEFYVDGKLHDRISGSMDWQQVMCTITGLGLHTLEWRYFKDGSVSAGQDSGWVDRFESQWWNWGDWWIEIQ